MGCGGSSEASQSAAPEKKTPEKETPEKETPEKETPSEGAVASAQKPENEMAKDSVPTQDYKDFLSCFDGTGKGDNLLSRENKDARTDQWKACDPNNNGYVSLAEYESWVKDRLQDAYGDRGETIWKAFRPSYIRGFKDAADAGKEKRVTQNSTTEDYIEKREFRVAINYLCIYAKFYDAFALIDGGGAGRSKDDDRKITLDEWKTSFEKVGPYEFAGFEGLEAASAEETFKKMDPNGSGSAMLSEFCRFLEKAEQSKGTEVGKLLAIGDDE